MKNYKALFLSLLLSFIITSSSHAIPIWFDADAGGGTYAPILIDEVSGSILTHYTIFQSLGADDILGNGDAFTLTDPLELAIYSGNVSGTPVVAYPIIPPTLYAELTGIGGTVSNYSDGGTPTTAASPGSIIDDTFTVDYTPNQGQIDFYYDADGDLDPTTGPATTLGTFEIVRGGGDVLKSDNVTLTSDIGLDLVATSVAAGVWFLDNGGAIGTDVATVIASGSTVFLSIVDNSVNLTNFAGFDSATPGLDRIDLQADDNGTDIEFDIAPIPEPTTILLFGLGLIGLAGVSRKRFVKKA